MADMSGTKTLVFAHLYLFHSGNTELNVKYKASQYFHEYRKTLTFTNYQLTSYPVSSIFINFSRYIHGVQHHAASIKGNTFNHASKAQ